MTSQKMADQFLLRRALDIDSVALSQLNQQTFRETYADDLAIPFGEHDLESHFRSSVSPEWFASKIVDPLRATWVVEDKTSRELVGFAVAGPCELRHPDIRSGEDGELSRLYVRRDRRAHGLGQWLMNAALSWLDERYAGRPVWISVWSGNLRAQNFYKHYGFSKVGDYYDRVGEWKDYEFLMRRERHSSS